MVFNKLAVYFAFFLQSVVGLLSEIDIQINILDNDSSKFHKEL
jgi:hypothetical protein